MLQKADDEDSWDKLEALRHAIIAEVEEIRLVNLGDGETVEQAAASIEKNLVDGHEGIFGCDVRDPYNPDSILVPKGAKTAERADPIPGAEAQEEVK